MQACTNYWENIGREVDQKTKSSLVSGSNSNKCGDNNLCIGTDIKHTASVVRTVLEGKGKSIMNKVNVHDLKDTCLDLKTYIKQRDNVFVFLPITNLQRLKTGQSLKPNKILSYEDFDPIVVHKTIRATGKYNFEEIKIQLPQKLILNFLKN